jgi:hypothetical protein
MRLALNEDEAGKAYYYDNNNQHHWQHDFNLVFLLTENVLSNSYSIYNFGCSGKKQTAQ